MKKTLIIVSFLFSVAAFSQVNMVDVIMDGKPAKLNVNTGVFTFTKGLPSNYKTETSTINGNISSTNNNLHSVIKGETLYSISKKYGISMAQIKSLNNLETNVLSLNQELKIGYNTSVEIKKTSIHIVEKGETLYSISKLTNVSVQDIKKLNNLEGTTLSIGQSLNLK